VRTDAASIDQERVTTRLGAELGTSAITRIDLVSGVSWAALRNVLLIPLTPCCICPGCHYQPRRFWRQPVCYPPPNKRGWSYLLCAESSPDCEFLDRKGHPIHGAISVKLIVPSSPYVHITLKRFMKIAHIPRYDELTQSHMIVNIIAHWTFFEAATKGKLTLMGFPLGTACLLCNAAAEIGPLVNENTRENTRLNHTLPLGVGYHWADVEFVNFWPKRRPSRLRTKLRKEAE
jgi:hypothetical protein